MLDWFPVSSNFSDIPISSSFFSFLCTLEIHFKFMCQPLFWFYPWKICIKHSKLSFALHLKMIQFLREQILFLSMISYVILYCLQWETIGISLPYKIHKFLKVINKSQLPPASYGSRPNYSQGFANMKIATFGVALFSVYFSYNVLHSDLSPFLFYLPYSLLRNISSVGPN